MDTKFLYDALIEQKVEIKSCDPEGAGEYWFEAIMANPDYLRDIYLDLIEEEMSGEEDTMDVDNMFNFTNLASKDLDGLQYGTRYEGLVMARATSFSFQCMNLGKAVLGIVSRQLRKHIELHQEEWFGDVAAYDYDMREDGRGDWLYEQAKDRRLDERF